MWFLVLKALVVRFRNWIGGIKKIDWLTLGDIRLQYTCHNCKKGFNHAIPPDGFCSNCGSDEFSRIKVIDIVHMTNDPFAVINGILFDTVDLDILSAWLNKVDEKYRDRILTQAQMRQLIKKD